MQLPSLPILFHFPDGTSWDHLLSQGHAPQSLTSGSTSGRIFIKMGSGGGGELGKRDKFKVCHALCWILNTNYCPLHPYPKAANHCKIADLVPLATQGRESY